MKALPTPTLVRRKLVLLIVLALGVSGWLASTAWRAYADAHLPCPVAMVEHALLGATCPRVGRMGDLKMVVPDHYLPGFLTYKGVDIWNYESFKNRPKQPTFDNEIDNFAIKIRQTNFKPIETRKDRDDYWKLGEVAAQPPENRWIYVSFESANALPRGYTMADQLKNWLKDGTSWGPFILQKDEVWGLKHYVSIHQPGPKTEQREIFYDPKTEDTFMDCTNTLQMFPPHKPLSSCQINFLIRDLKLTARVSNIGDKNDLARWAEIERGIKQVVQSFVVP